MPPDGYTFNVPGIPRLPVFDTVIVPNPPLAALGSPPRYTEPRVALPAEMADTPEPPDCDPRLTVLDHPTFPPLCSNSADPPPPIVTASDCKPAPTVNVPTNN